VSFDNTSLKGAYAGFGDQSGGLRSDSFSGEFAANGASSTGQH